MANPRTFQPLVPDSKSGVGDIVGACGAGTDLDVIHQALAFLEQPYLHIINRRIIIRAVIEHSGDLDVVQADLADSSLSPQFAAKR